MKDATDIVRLIGEHVALKPRGREFVGLCPFHPDKNPSMCVVPAKQIFHCFVCQTGGDALGFAMKFHKMEFREALEFLAERAGIELPKWKPAHAEHAGGSGAGGGGSGGGGGEPETLTRRDLVASTNFASEYFRTLLKHPQHGQAGRAVVAKRQITPEAVEEFGIGVSADRWDGLLMTLKAKGLSERAAIEAGLLKRRESDGGFYDAFRNRLMFPIHDTAGRVIAFGARKIKEEDEPKYLNSPETRLFSKSQVLYGLYQAASAIRQTRTAIITEGYMDTVACHQAGVKNVVATLGTALTREHANLLSRQADGLRVVLLFDGDDAGQRAADRAVEVFFSEPVDVRICTLSSHTDAKDPDELLKREGGAAVLQKAVDASTDLIEYRFGRVRARLANAGVSALAQGVRDEIARLRELGLADVEPIKQQIIIKHLARIAGVDEAFVRHEALADGGRRVARAAGPALASETDREEARRAEIRRLSGPGRSAFEALLGCVLLEPRLIKAIQPAERHELCGLSTGSAVVAALAEMVDELSGSDDEPGLHRVTNHARENLGETAEHVVAAATALAETTRRETEIGDDRLPKLYEDCLRECRRQLAVASPGHLDAAARLRRLKEEHQMFGGNQRKLPNARLFGQKQKPNAAPSGGEESSPDPIDPMH